ncbi:uncharacterized protein LOC116215255 [Punica granatum]|uniref:Uncharacterized protein LOC116215255 n=2 Tax=Punica granatum TaxID=22663 RepID=A0A6P8ELM8_PUNGR|nr:uncharacterized protein LOC116215255 [Punica granatum]
MAKRSDFAQKLLDDLRLRKERLAGAQNSGGAPKAKTRDAYAYPKQTFRGSTNHGKAAMRVDNTQRRTNGGTRALPREESSAQLVPFGRGQGSQQIGDLSMALAFALENGGKLRQIDSSGRSSVLTFLPQTGRTGLQSQGNRSRTPAISHLHVQEISKGAQKLNQILRACSNGMNFDQYSIEIGKELLKGAMDLQESLKMLVNLQQASDFMVRPQRKSRIVLLEDDKEIEEEEDSDKEIEKKQLDLLPRFSFDKPTRQRHPQKQQRLPAVVYPSETLNSVAAHKRSTSYRNETGAPPSLQEKKNASNPLNRKVEKGRMSNLIAKLMGLEEVPGKTGSERDQGKASETKSKGKVGPVVPPIKPDIAKPNIAKSGKNNPMTPNDAVSFVLQAEKNFASRTARNAAAKFQEKPPWKHPESAKAMMAMDRAFISQLRKQVGDQNGELNNRRGTDEIETRLAIQEKVEVKEKKTLTDMRNQNRMRTDVQFGQSYVSRNSESPKEKQPESEKKQQQTVRQKKGNEPISRAPLQRARPNTNQLKPKKYVPNEAVHLKPSKEIPHGQQGPRGGKLTEQDKTETPKISRLKKTRGTTLEDVAKPLPYRSASQEAKQLNRGEANTVRLAKMEVTTEVMSNVGKGPKREGEVVTPASRLNSEESQGMKKRPSLASEDTGRSVLSPVTNDWHSAVVLNVDEKLGSAKAIPNPSNGTITDTRSLSFSHPLDKENMPVPELQEPLTESGTQLKRVLMKSRLFLNTAEALLKLNIPISILNVSGQDYPREDDDDNLALDCAFEVIKRKGKRLELAVHPLTRKAAGISYMTIMNFDDVVRQLDKSFEGLRSHGRNGWHDCEVEDYLPRMLELDIHARDPETDCMWDLGWDGPTFAILEKDEVVKDVEKLVISGLIDEMARDLLHK